MWWVIFVVQWLHVLCGIIWLGSTLYLNFVVIPATMSLPFAQQRAFSERIGKLSERLITPAATLVIILGLLRGTLLGPITSLGALFGTAYGITFFMAFLVTIATYFWGLFQVAGTARKLNAIPVSEEMLAEGKVPVEYSATLQRLKIFGLLELLGFFTIFTCMILMRFGY